MDNIISNQYIPEYVYDDINSNLESLKEQSNKLHQTFSQLDEKCTRLEIIQDSDVNEIITKLREYILIKENCLEKSSSIVSIDGISLIETLSEQVQTHKLESTSAMNNILYYAYEFLKVSSNNIITDGLLQDHKEKIKNIINTTLKSFVDISEVAQQIKPYKIAMQYILNQDMDLTEHAELLNSTFGAILFYNIISGNNLEYSPDTQIEVFEEESIPVAQENINFNEYETDEVIDDTSMYDDYSDNDSEGTDEETITMEIVDEYINHLDEEYVGENYEEDEPQEDLEDVQEEDIEETYVDTTEQEQAEESEEVAEETESEPIEETPLTETDTAEEVAETPSIEVEELETPIEEEESETQPTEEPQPTVDTENPSVEEPSIIEETDETIIEEFLSDDIELAEEEETPAVEVKVQEEKDFLDTLTDRIELDLKHSTREIPTNKNTLTTEEITDLVIKYTLELKYCCVSLVLKQYSNIDKFNVLYNQYGLAFNDPMVDKSNYVTAFSDTFNEELQPWLQLSALLRMMATSPNKESESYNFGVYMKSIQQNYYDTFAKLYKFDEMLNILESVHYNMDYIIGVRAYEERGGIISELKVKAKTTLLVCEQLKSSLKGNKAKIATSLFSPNSGYLYSLINQISQGNLDAMSEIKAYCEKFVDSNGRIVSSSVVEYFEQLCEECGEAKHAHDHHNAYKKFYDKFSTIIKFFTTCIEKVQSFENDCVNKDNLMQYREKRNVLARILNFNHTTTLTDLLKDTSLSKAGRAGITCLRLAMNDLISYIYIYEIPTQNYYYVSLLRTAYFMLDDNLVPYLYDDLNDIDGLSLYDRVKSHLEDIANLGYSQESPWWKDTIKYNVKRNNKNNVVQIISYIKESKQTSKTYEEYINKLENSVYNLESKSKEFITKVTSLYTSGVLCNRAVLDRVLDIEENVKEIVTENGNYGFYEYVLSNLTEYAKRVCKEEYSRDDLINAVSEDSVYYPAIRKYVDSCHYSIADEYLCMYFNKQEYPKDIIPDDTLKEYDEIFSHFMEFTRKYANSLSSPNGYIFMNEVYNSDIKPIVDKLFAGSYDCVRSDELIGSWSKGANVVDKVAYDVLSNIGFGIDKYENLSDTVVDLKLSKSEKNNSTPYTLPTRAIFINQLYNIAHVRQRLGNLKVEQDTLIILDYALKDNERQHVFQSIQDICNGHSVVVVDRCIIMYLTTIPIAKRKFAFKVCSMFNSKVDSLTMGNFRNDYVQEILNDKGNRVVLGRDGLGKTSIFKGLEEVLKQGENNIVISLNAKETTLETPSTFVDAFKDTNLKVYCDTWTAFSKSLGNCLKKSHTVKVFLLIDDGDAFLSSEVAKEAIPQLQELTLNTNGQFRYIITADREYKYSSMLNGLKVETTMLKPLTYGETSELIQRYLNIAKVNVSSNEVMDVLVAKTFGYPKLVKLVTDQVIDTVHSEENLFDGKYYYTLTQEVAEKSFTNGDFIKAGVRNLLEMLSDDKETFNDTLSVVYSMVYCLDDSSSCTIQDVKDVLNINNIEENAEFNLQYTLNMLQDLNIVINLENEYYFSHNALRYYFGSSDFAVNVLSECSKMFEKDGIA